MFHIFVVVVDVMNSLVNKNIGIHPKKDGWYILTIIPNIALALPEHAFQGVGDHVDWVGPS